jgi:hypothetical protein
VPLCLCVSIFFFDPMNLEVDGERTLIRTMPTFFINMSGFQPSIFCWRIPRPPFGRKLPLFFLGSLNVRPSVLYFKGFYVNGDFTLINRCTPKSAPTFMLRRTLTFLTLTVGISLGGRSLQELQN